MERPGLKTTGSDQGKAVAKNKIRETPGSIHRRQVFLVKKLLASREGLFCTTS